MELFLLFCSYMENYMVVLKIICVCERPHFFFIYCNNSSLHIQKMEIKHLHLICLLPDLKYQYLEK